MAFRPGRVDDHQAPLQQGVRVVDEGVAPGRHLDRAVAGSTCGLSARADRGSRSPARSATSTATRWVQRHGRQRARQRIGLARIQRDALPGFVASAQFGQRQAAQAGLDGQQRQPSATPAASWKQFDRAHRRAARRGRQHAAPGVGEEDRVDQLGLAARELGNEGQHQPVGEQALTKGLEPGLFGGLGQVMVAQETRVLGHVAVERASPGSLAVQAGNERAVHGSATMLAHHTDPAQGRNTC
jgi:hypothetical protein